MPPAIALRERLTSEQLMLVAMTYNTYLVASIVVGAFTGHLLYEGEMDVGYVRFLGGHKTTVKLDQSRQSAQVTVASLYGVAGSSRSDPS